VYLWRRTVETNWVKTHADLLQAHAPGQLVIVRRPGRKRLELEIVCRSRSDSSSLVKEFGGHIEALPHNWLQQFARGESKPIKIGKRLIISNDEGALHSSLSPHQNRSHIIIPASLAFGTGEHATTAMSLRFLEQLTCRWKPGWSLVDLGTGSGILALAAKRFGAGRVVGVDNDPTAISVAKSNARLNRIRGVSFQLGDVRNWNSGHKTDVITANLYSDLLIETLVRPGSEYFILSGILRSQQTELVNTLQANDYDIISTRRRGKWVAILSRRTGGLRPPDVDDAKFLRRS